MNCRFKETIKVLDAKQSMYIYPEEINSKQEYRTLSFVYFDTHQQRSEMSKYTKLRVVYSCFEFIFSIL